MSMSENRDAMVCVFVFTDASSGGREWPPSTLGFRGKAEALSDAVEAGVGSELGEQRSHDRDTKGIVVEGPIQPDEGPVIIAECNVDLRDVVTRCAPRCLVSEQSVQHPHRLGARAGMHERVRVQSRNERRLRYWP